MHKVRVVKNSFCRRSKNVTRLCRKQGIICIYSEQDVFLDMLTDSGVNAMSDNQLAAMQKADDAYLLQNVL